MKASRSARGLTRGGWVLGVILVFVFAMAAPDSAPTFLVISLLLALPLVNVPWARAAVRGVEVTRTHPTHVREGTPVRVRLQVSNQTARTQLLLQFVDGVPRAFGAPRLQCASLAAGARQVLHYDATVNRRGVYTLSTCRVESAAPFGLVTAGRDVPVSSELVVYPLYYELTGAAFPFRKTSSGMASVPGSRPGEGPSFFGLREYRSGDPIRKIHWPSSMRARALLVKEFEEDMHSALTIAIDNFRESVVETAEGSTLEVAVRAAATLANYMVTNGHPVVVSHADAATRTVRQDRATGNLTPALDGLARLQPSDVPASDLVARVRRSSPHANLVVVLLSLDGAGVAELLRARGHGAEVLVVLVDPWGSDRARPDTTEFTPLAGLLDSAGVALIPVKPGDDLAATLSQGLRPPRHVQFHY
jgi:uncharacterized protein (DUF58 family)